MMAETTLFGAFILGLMGASHCIGMCGGIISSLSLATDTGHHRWLKVTCYQFGRISTYSLFGLLAGLIGNQASQLTSFPVLPTVSGILLILMGLYISRIWMVITYFERAGKLIWNKISPLSKRLLPVTSVRQALLLGALWGWLPCGLVYTAMGYSITTASPIDSSLFMLFFGLGTLPATLLAGAASTVLKTWLNQPVIRTISAMLFIGLGGYILFELYLSAGDVSAHHHHH